MALTTIVSASISVSMAGIGKFIVDSVVAAHSAVSDEARLVSIGGVIYWALLEFALVVISAFVERTAGVLKQRIGSLLSVEINVMIMEKALTLDLIQFEDSAFHDKLTRARREASSRPLSLIQGHFQIARNVLTLLGYGVLLLKFSPWMVVGLLFAAIPAFISEARFSAATYRLRKVRSPIARILTYLEYIIANDTHAKEIRLLGLGPSLVSRYRRLAGIFLEDDLRAGRSRAIWTFVLSLITTSAYYCCYLVVAVATARGQLSIGDMTLCVLAFRQGQGSFQNILSAIGGILEDNLYMSNLYEYLSLLPKRIIPKKNKLDRAEKGVRFESVSFRYPGAGRCALSDISLFIPAGRSLGVVGENGSGKTTLIKLLTGLYEPDSGAVLIDGVDLRDLDREVINSRISMIFQDFNKYKLSVHENVGFGDIAFSSDSDRINRAIDNGGARGVVAGLSQGIDTILSRQFENGSDLSGGQWQKIALARAFMKEKADIFILDEPTSSMDSLAELRLFERFRDLTTGRTSVVISHRFPTVRRAEQIVVIDDGSIIERGSHSALLTLNGKYAHMFKAQAAGYEP